MARSRKRPVSGVFRTQRATRAGAGGVNHDRSKFILSRNVATCQDFKRGGRLEDGVTYVSRLLSRARRRPRPPAGASGFRRRSRPSRRPRRPPRARAARRSSRASSPAAGPRGRARRRASRGARAVARDATVDAKAWFPARSRPASSLVAGSPGLGLRRRSGLRLAADAGTGARAGGRAGDPVCSGRAAADLGLRGAAAAILFFLRRPGGHSRARGARETSATPRRPPRAASHLRSAFALRRPPGARGLGGLKRVSAASSARSSAPRRRRSRR